MKMNLFDYYTLVKNQHISISYSGPILQEGIIGIVNTLKKHLQAENAPINSSQSVFSIFIEQMQNIVNYSAEKQIIQDIENGTEFEVSSGIFVLGSENGKYIMHCGNKIKNDSIQLITERINHLNSLSKDEVRKFYREKIRAENENPESKGAGLGLIEIARRSSNPIEYDFVPIDDSNSFFSLCVSIDK